jgi:glyoxylate utilization-related uncharacterized protein
MRFRTTRILLLGVVVIADSAAAQNAPAPPAAVRTVIAATKLPTVTDVPLYFAVASIELAPGAKSSVSNANSILYQISGSTEVSLAGEAKMLNSGNGLFVGAGKTAELKAGGDAPSTWTWTGLPRWPQPS